MNLGAEIMAGLVGLFGGSKKQQSQTRLWMSNPFGAMIGGKAAHDKGSWEYALTANTIQIWGFEQGNYWADKYDEAKVKESQQQAKLTAALSAEAVALELERLGALGASGQPGLSVEQFASWVQAEESRRQQWLVGGVVIAGAVASSWLLLR